ncbi:MAG: class I SAM-dependent methyltransferase, partial [Candidatus Udaeobacter sp.]
DVVEGAIEDARKSATAEGFDGLTYEVADLNAASFPTETYAAVYAHASLHHIFHLEHVLDQIKQTLKLDCLLCTSTSGLRKCSCRGEISNWRTPF